MSTATKQRSPNGDGSGNGPRCEECDWPASRKTACGSKVNASGVVMRPKSIRVSIPKTLRAKAEVLVAYLPGGWRAEFEASHMDGGRGAPITERTTPFATEREAVADALERLARYFQDCEKHGGPTARKRATLMTRAVVQFTANYSARHKLTLPLPTPNGRAQPVALLPSPEAAARRNGREGPSLIVAARKAKPAAPAVIDVASRPASAMSTAEKRDLARCERIIERFRESMLEFAQALRTIREQQLWRGTHASFTEYLLARWRIDAKEASDKIQALESHEATEKVQKKLGVQLRNEGQLRALAGLEPDDKCEVLKRAAAKAKRAGEELVARHISAAKREYETPPEDLERDRQRRAEQARQRADSRPKAAGPPPLEAASDMSDQSDRSDQFRSGGAFAMRVDTIGQACCVLRSWVAAMIRQFPREDLSKLDEELYRQCGILRAIYRPALAESAPPSKGKAK